MEGCEKTMDIIKEYKFNIFLHIKKVKFSENLRKIQDLKALLAIEKN